VSCLVYFGAGVPQLGRGVGWLEGVCVWQWARAGNGNKKGCVSRGRKRNGHADAGWQKRAGQPKSAREKGARPSKHSKSAAKHRAA
jgi:hypothetical protein